MVNKGIFKELILIQVDVTLTDALILTWLGEFQALLIRPLSEEYSTLAPNQENGSAINDKRKIVKKLQLVYYYTHRERPMCIKEIKISESFQRMRCRFVAKDVLYSWSVYVVCIHLYKLFYVSTTLKQIISMPFISYLFSVVVSTAFMVCSPFFFNFFFLFLISSSLLFISCHSKWKHE